MSKHMSFQCALWSIAAVAGLVSFSGVAVAQSRHFSEAMQAHTGSQEVRKSSSKVYSDAAGVYARPATNATVIRADPPRPASGNYLLHESTHVEVRISKKVRAQHALGTAPGGLRELVAE